MSEELKLVLIASYFIALAIGVVIGTVSDMKDDSKRSNGDVSVGVLLVGAVALLLVLVTLVGVFVEAQK